MNWADTCTLRQSYKKMARHSRCQSNPNIACLLMGKYTDRISHPTQRKTPLSHTIYFSITGLFPLTFSAAATAIFFSLSSRNFLK
jgi:hypothetical protein